MNKKNTPIHFSIVFTLGFIFESFKEFGGASLGLGYGVAKLDEQMGLINQVEVVNQG